MVYLLYKLSIHADLELFSEYLQIQVDDPKAPGCFLLVPTAAHCWVHSPSSHSPAGLAQLSEPHPLSPLFHRSPEVPHTSLPISGCQHNCRSSKPPSPAKSWLLPAQLASQRQIHEL